MLRQEDLLSPGVKTSLGNTVRLCLKKRKRKKKTSMLRDSSTKGEKRGIPRRRDMC
jgi:hypothetical protein